MLRISWKHRHIKALRGTKPIDWREEEEKAPGFLSAHSQLRSHSRS